MSLMAVKIYTYQAQWIRASEGPMVTLMSMCTNAISDLYLDPFNDTSAWAGPSNSRPTTDVGSYAASTGSSEEDSMDLDDPSIQFTTYSDSESTISIAKSYSEKRDAFRRNSNGFNDDDDDDDDDDDSDSFQSFYESVQSDLQPSLPADDKVSEVQCKRSAKGDDSVDGCRRTSKLVRRFGLGLFYHRIIQDSRFDDRAGERWTR